MSLAAKYRADVSWMTALAVKLRGDRPAPTIRAAALAPAAPPTQAGDDAEVSKHIYMSDQPEPGQETTALGRYADATIRVPLERPAPAEQTRVINAYGVERALATEVLEEPLLFNLLAGELGYPAYDPPVEPADLLERDPGADSVRLSTVRPAHLGDA
jgi:hypothetical protein